MQFSRSVSFWLCIVFVPLALHTHFWRFFLCCQFMRTYARAHSVPLPHTHTYVNAGGCLTVCGSFYTWFWRSVDQINFMARRHFCPLLSVCAFYVSVCVWVCLCVSESRCGCPSVVLPAAGKLLTRSEQLKFFFYVLFLLLPTLA